MWCTGFGRSPDVHPALRAHGAELRRMNERRSRLPAPDETAERLFRELSAGTLTLKLGGSGGDRPLPSTLRRTGSGPLEELGALARVRCQQRGPLELAPGLI